MTAYITWTGDKITYSRLHEVVNKLRGKPRLCERCGTTDAVRFDWANLTGRYEDPYDYQRMCRSCHRRYDMARHRAGDLSTREACERIGISHATLLTLMRAGLIEARRVGPSQYSAWGISAQSVADYIARRAA